MAKANGFVRSLFAAVLLVSLAACGGGDGDGGAAPAATPPSKLFVFDSPGKIGSLGISIPATGTFTFVFDRIIYGPKSGLDASTRSIALDAVGDRLYVGSQSNEVVFNQVGTASGNNAPARTFQATGSRNASLFTIDFTRQFLDVSNNRLYVADGAGSIFVLNGASTLSGGNTPSRSIFPDYGNASGFGFDLAVDTSKNMIYVGYSPDIFVFNNADTVNTIDPLFTVPDRKLSFSSRPISFYLDSIHDRLYVSLINGSIQVFDNASFLPTGTPTPNRTLSMDAALGPYFIFVETTNDRLYAVAGGHCFIINGASTATVAGPGNGAWLIVSNNYDYAQFKAVAVKP
jgi:hypothetical protein